jgi:hypothetical protein
VIIKVQESAFENLKNSQHSLLVRYEKPDYWEQGIICGSGVILVEVHTDEGLIGYGEHNRYAFCR